MSYLVFWQKKNIFRQLVVSLKARYFIGPSIDQSLRAGLKSPLPFDLSISRYRLGHRCIEKH